MTAPAAAPARVQVLVDAPARLHMGFVDLNGGLGRRFGSLGVALDVFPTRLSVSPARELAAVGPFAERVRVCAQRLCAQLGLPAVGRFEVLQAPPAHVGLGSGTQLALAVGTALARLYDLPLGLRDIARFAERGARSGIGTGIFDQGGFVVDGGRGRQGDVPPVIARLPFPDGWRFILVLDRRVQGLHGAQELAAFRSLPAFPAERAAHLARIVLMRILPALSEQDLPAFGSAITELQAIIGDYFARAQGGRFASARVARALAWLGEAGATAIGQSSWGPTGFALVEHAGRARDLVAEAKRSLASANEVDFLVAGARQCGATIAVQADHGRRVALDAGRAAHRRVEWRP